MSSLNPDIKIRHLVAIWPDDAPRGAVSAFCRKHKVSRTWFYKVRAAAQAGSTMEEMELKSTRPVKSPARTNQAMEDLLLQTRAFLMESGFDYGPLSVIARLGTPRRDAAVTHDRVAGLYPGRCRGPGTAEEAA